MSPTILILGGYGHTGRLIAELLLQRTAVDLILAGRNQDRAATLAHELTNRYPGRRITAHQVDAADKPGLIQALAGVDLMVVAASATQYAAIVVAAALEAGVDYLDTQLSTPDKIAALRGLEPQIRDQGLRFIADGGFHPGVPAALIQFAADHLDDLSHASVGSVIQIDWAPLDLSPATIEEMVQELTQIEPLVFQDGAWSRTSWSAYRSFDFDPPFGRRSCIPMFLEELRDLPDRIPTLQETGFYVGGFNWFSDYVVIPLGFMALKLWPRRAVSPLARLWLWSLRRFSRPPYGTVLLLNAEGRREGQGVQLRLTLTHEDGYWLTAVPVVATLLQLLDGTIASPGVWLQGSVADPLRLLHDMAAMDIQVEATLDGRRFSLPALPTAIPQRNYQPSSTSS